MKHRREEPLRPRGPCGAAVSPAERWSSTPTPRGRAGLRYPGDPARGPSQAYRAGALSAPGPPGRLHPSNQRAPAPPSACAQHPQLFQGHLLQEARRRPSTLLATPLGQNRRCRPVLPPPPPPPEQGLRLVHAASSAWGRGEGGSMQGGCGQHPGPTSWSLGGEHELCPLLSPGRAPCWPRCPRALERRWDAWCVGECRPPEL